MQNLRLIEDYVPTDSKNIQENYYNKTDFDSSTFWTPSINANPSKNVEVKNLDYLDSLLLDDEVKYTSNDSKNGEIKELTKCKK